jgi:hypothetical protein
MYWREVFLGVLAVLLICEAYFLVSERIPPYAASNLGMRIRL